MSHAACRSDIKKSFFNRGDIDTCRGHFIIEVMKKKNAQGATKADVEDAVEEVAVMAQGEFRHIREEMATKKVVGELHENMLEGFSAIRQEMQEGFRAVLAAIETVEYTKLRMRIDSLETDVAKIKQKVRVR